MSWYRKYIRVYEQPIGSVPPSIIEEVRSKLKRLQQGQQLQQSQQGQQQFQQEQQQQQEQQPQQEQQQQQPSPITASVVIIAHNEETRLLSCLWSLCDNECDFPVEILVVNNHSTDHTEAVLQTLGATYYNETQKGPGHARQCGLNHARGTYHLCADADTVYPPHYIATHVRELSRRGVVCTFGLWSFMPDKHHSRAGLWGYETLRDLHLRLQAVKRPELCVRGMNFAFDTALARRFGFRTDIRRGEDGSLALNLKPYGQLLFLTGKRVRVLTGNGTLNADGSLLKSLWVRIVKAAKGVTGLFTPKKTYEDKDSNLLN